MVKSIGYDDIKIGYREDCDTCNFKVLCRKLCIWDDATKRNAMALIEANIKGEYE